MGISRGFGMVSSFLKNAVLPFLGIVLLLGGGEQWLPFLAAAGVHELGHLAAAGCFGVRLRHFGTGSGGLFLDFCTETISYGREIFILLSGSFIGFISVWVCRRMGIWSAYCTCAMGLNLINLLPVAGLDGGRICFCLLHHWMEGDRADRVYRAVAVVGSILFWLIGVWIVLRVGPNVTWMLCGMAAVLKSLREWEFS